MHLIKKIKIVIVVLSTILMVSPNAWSTEECFEGTSRAIFKFNVVLDDAILEPLANFVRFFEGVLNVLCFKISSMMFFIYTATSSTFDCI